MRQKLHSQYFQDYFKYLSAKTIVVESEYVDRDYLEDYIGYYGRCFTPPPRFCARLHFFQTEFKAEEFMAFLTGSTERESFRNERLKPEAYLGFVVVKPLSDTFVGRTCLKTYPTAGTGRNYPALRDYDAHLCGVPFTVRSLAFQEQDTEVARCATSALWSAFQGTAKKYGHTVPTPVEITKSALSVHSYQSRTLPAKDGLTLEQMGDAIRKLNLEPYFSELSDRTHLQTEAYAYLRAGIPVLLVVSLIDTTDEWDKPLPDGIGLYSGCHAVALTGYRIADETSFYPLAGTSSYIRATKISRFYAHDDQIGPFARMVFSLPGVSCKWKEDDGRTSPPSYFLETSWWGASGRIGSMVAVPETLIVPLYPKMRVTFREALEAMQKFDALMVTLSGIGHVKLPNPLEWDIFLTTSSEAKEEWLQKGRLTGAVARDLLTLSMPKYMWRAVASKGDKPLFELLFDATAIIQGSFFFRAIEYDKRLLRILRNRRFLSFARDTITRSMLEWFHDSARQSRRS